MHDDLRPRLLALPDPEPPVRAAPPRKTYVEPRLQCHGEVARLTLLTFSF